MNQNDTIDNSTGKFVITCKKYEDDKMYEDFESYTVAFDPSFLELPDIANLNDIMSELNKLSSKLYYYGFLCDIQNRVVQQLEDEFERWKTEKYFAHSMDDKQYKTEKSKERFVYMQYKDEYVKFMEHLNKERYYLSLLMRVMKSLEFYGYKLHDLKDYNLTYKNR